MGGQGKDGNPNCYGILSSLPLSRHSASPADCQALLVWQDSAWSCIPWLGGGAWVERLGKTVGLPAVMTGSDWIWMDIWSLGMAAGYRCWVSLLVRVAG